MSDPVASDGPLTSSGFRLQSSDALFREEPSRPGTSLSPTGVAAESDVRTHSPGAAGPGNPAEPHNPEEPPGWVENLGWLPMGYGDDRLVCMPRDPTCAFVYWDLSERLVSEAFEGLLPARALLKLFHLSGSLLREVEIDLGMRGFYLRELPPGSEFRVELWAAGANGARLLRATRPVWLPPAEPSTLLDEQYLHIWLDNPLSAAKLIATRPSVWRAASDFPGWSHEPKANTARAASSSMFPSGTGQLFVETK